MIMARLRNDTLCGFLVIAIALGFGWAATGYDIGTARRMGPGFFPLMAAVILCLFGLVILMRGVASSLRGEAEEAPGPPVAWRPGLIILGSLLFFGATASGLGLVPSLAVTVFLASRAGSNSWRQSLVQCAVLTVLCTVIFQMGLGLKLPLIGPWLHGV